MRLGVSPTAASTPKGFSISSLGLYFPVLEPWCCAVCFTLSLFLPVYLHANVGPQGPPATASQGLPATFCRESSLPSCPSPPLLSVWMNVSSLTPWSSDFHTVRFSISSGCFLFLNCCCPSFGYARRHSVSTYAFILAGSPKLLMII